MTVKEAERIIRAKRPHSENCERRETGLWDKTGNCERCSAWGLFNDALIASGDFPRRANAAR